jgi:hypothetical protein
MSYNLVLNYSASGKYKNLPAVAADIQDISAIHSNEDPTTVKNIDIRLTDLGPRLSVRIERPTPPDSMEKNGDKLAKIIGELDIEQDSSTAAAKIEIRSVN